MEHELPAVLTVGEVLWRLGVAGLPVAANGFFVAAELALVGARRTRIEQLAEHGHTRARLAGVATTHLDHFSSASQLEHEEVQDEIQDTGEATLLSGSAPVTDVNERFGLMLPEEDFTTMGGFVMKRLGRLPRPGTDVRFEGGGLRVPAMDGRRILRSSLVLTHDDGSVATGSE